MWMSLFTIWIGPVIVHIKCCNDVAYNTFVFGKYKQLWSEVTRRKNHIIGILTKHYNKSLPDNKLSDLLHFCHASVKIEKRLMYYDRSESKLDFTEMYLMNRLSPECFYSLWTDMALTKLCLIH